MEISIAPGLVPSGPGYRWAYGITFLIPVIKWTQLTTHKIPMNTLSTTNIHYFLWETGKIMFLGVLGNSSLLFNEIKQNRWSGEKVENHCTLKEKANQPRESGEILPCLYTPTTTAAYFLGFYPS